MFTALARVAREAYDRIVGLRLSDIAIDGCITKAPGGGECAGPSPVDRRKQALKRSVLVEGYGIPLGRVLAGANRHDSPLLGPTLDRLDDLGPLPEQVTMHLDAGYDSDKTRTLLHERGLLGGGRAAVGRVMRRSTRRAVRGCATSSRRSRPSRTRSSASTNRACW